MCNSSSNNFYELFVILPLNSIRRYTSFRFANYSKLILLDSPLEETMSSDDGIGFIPKYTIASLSTRARLGYNDVRMISFVRYYS